MKKLAASPEKLKPTGQTDKEPKMAIQRVAATKEVLESRQYYNKQRG